MTLLLAFPVSDVVKVVASSVDLALPDQCQILDVGAEGEAHRRAHLVGAFAGEFDGRVADVVDIVDVVAGTADHGVGAGAAIKNVVAAVADDGVVEVVADAVRLAVPVSVRSSTLAPSV